MRYRRWHSILVLTGLALCLVMGTAGLYVILTEDTYERGALMLGGASIASAAIYFWVSADFWRD